MTVRTTQDHDDIEVVYGTEDSSLALPMERSSPDERKERMPLHSNALEGGGSAASRSCELDEEEDEEEEHPSKMNCDENEFSSSKRKKSFLIAAIVIVVIATAVAIAIPLALSSHSSSNSPSPSHSSASNGNNENMVHLFAGDISEFMTSNTILSRQSSYFRAMECPQGESLWKLRLVTDNYPWETKWELIREGEDDNDSDSFESDSGVWDDKSTVNATVNGANITITHIDSANTTATATVANNSTTNAVLASGPPDGLNYARNTNYTGNLCLPRGTYHMRWYDRSADGICCDDRYGRGHWEVSVDGAVVLENDPDDDNFTVRDFAFRVGDGAADVVVGDAGDDDIVDLDFDDDVDFDFDVDLNDDTVAKGRIAGMYLGRRFPSAHIELKDGTIYRLLNLPPDFDYDGFVSGVTAIAVSNETQFFSNSTADLKGTYPLLLERKRHHHERMAEQYEKEGAFPEKTRQRNLADFNATKSIVVVRVIASDGATSFNESYLGDSVFGNGVDDANVVSQMKACSYDKLIFQKAPDKVGLDNRTTVIGVDDATNNTTTVAANTTNSANDTRTEIVKLANGVVTITLPTTSIAQGDATMRNEITRRLNSVFNVRHPRQLADFAMYCLPENTMSGIAYAYMNSWLSVYSDRWCTYLSIQMHEFGHSLNFGHSNEEGISYQDESGYMGFSYPNDDVPLMCYNAAKSWQTGWYDDKSIVVRVDDPPSCFNGTLHGIADYPIATTVLLKIENESGIDQFVNYNAKKGINMGTQDGANLVTVVSRPAGIRDSYAESELVAKLGVGENYTLPGFVVMVEDVDLNDGVARVIVLPDALMGNGTCDDYGDDTSQKI
mmetsp:Transcript_12511/g.25504  ORF Transcript_12511/g.25504 Transcript_12511/m.25504 type:complete len:841 (+) Transcript_12511:202-2724(+)